MDHFLKIKINYRIFLLMFLTAVINGCGNQISLYDQYSYTQTTSVKVDVLNLMDKATESYSGHAKEVEDVNTELLKNIEYEKHRTKNTISITMYNVLWKLINDTTTIHVFRSDFKHGFFPEWKKRDSIGDTAFISQAKLQIGEGFDLIAELESQKIKPSDAGITSFLSKNK